jgi:hypothetical protein
VEDKTNNYIRQIVWNTVEYRWEKYFLHKLLMKWYSWLCAYRNCLPQQLETNCPPPHSTYYSIIKEKYFQPTNTTIFDESLPSNVEVNNLNNFIDYYVGLHGVLLELEDL